MYKPFVLLSNFDTCVTWRWSLRTETCCKQVSYIHNKQPSVMTDGFFFTFGIMITAVWIDFFFNLAFICWRLVCSHFPQPLDTTTTTTTVVSDTTTTIIIINYYYCCCCVQSVLTFLGLTTATLCIRAYIHAYPYTWAQSTRSSPRICLFSLHCTFKNGKSTYTVYSTVLNSSLTKSPGSPLQRSVG